MPVLMNKEQIEHDFTQMNKLTEIGNDSNIRKLYFHRTVKLGRSCEVGKVERIRSHLSATAL